MLKLSCSVKRVYVHHDEARAEGTAHGNRVLQDVGHHDRNPFALDQAQFVLQVAGELQRQLVELAVGQRLAHAGECPPAGEFGHREFDHVAHRPEWR